MLKEAETTTLPKGTSIYREGQLKTFFYVVIEGVVSLSHVRHFFGKSKEIPAYSVYTGECFGESDVHNENQSLSWLEESPHYNHSARCESVVIALRMPIDSY